MPEIPVRIVPLVLLAGLVSASLSMSASAASPDPCLAEDKFVMDVLDPALDSTRKAQPLQAMQSLAAAGCADAAWVLGNMQRFGPELPGNPLPKDVAGAAALLEQAGLAGRESAYRDLAELALGEGKPRDAMSWTQVSLWLANTGSGATRRAAHGYDADLLRRATRAWYAAGLDKSQIQPLLGAYLAGHGPGLLAARERLRAWEATKPHLALAKSRRVHPADVGGHSGYVMFRVEAKPSGEVTRVAVESYGPTADVVERLRPMVKGTRLVPFEATESMTGTLPIVFAASP